MKDTRYKFLRLVDGQVKSQSGDMTWKLGEWQKANGSISLCSNGLHCSARMFDAFSYVDGEIVARIEAKGDHNSSEDKQAWAKMRLVDIRLWRKEDSVALAIFAAETCIELFEAQYPNDVRPRKAIEAAKIWLKNPTDKARDAAWAAAEAAEAAWAAARAAAWAARAAEAAWAAARAAARAAAGAAGAAEAARAAAWAAEAAWAAGAAWVARAAAVQKVNDWMEARFDRLDKF